MFSSSEQTLSPRRIVGVSLSVGTNATSIFNSGVQQNALFFAELLVEMNYEVYIISDSIDCENFDILKYNDHFKFIHYTDFLDYNFDVIFTIGLKFIEELHVPILRGLKTKLIFYKCSADLLLDCESFTQKKNGTISHFPYYDEVWCIPQNFYINHHYFKTLYKCPVKEVPFVWSDTFINKDEWLYSPNKDLKNRIAIFEPNISIMKCAIPPLIICENAYRINQNINKVFVTNIGDVKSDKNIDIEVFNQFVNHLDLHRDNKVFIEDRYQTIPMMKFSAHVAVSHTNLNPLNYLYFDLAYMGYPILHNAHMCKDIGYYYEDNHFEKAGKMLCSILENHDTSYLEYLQCNRLLLKKYMPKDELLQYKYKQLIEYTN